MPLTSEAEARPWTLVFARYGTTTPSNLTLPGDTRVATGREPDNALAALVRHRGHVMSRADLLREVWGYAAGTESRTVETHLAALRERLGDDPQAPKYIVTVRRAGYRLAG